MHRCRNHRSRSASSDPGCNCRPSLQGRTDRKRHSADRHLYRCTQTGPHSPRSHRTPACHRASTPAEGYRAPVQWLSAGYWSGRTQPACCRWSPCSGRRSCDWRSAGSRPGRQTVLRSDRAESNTEFHRRDP